MAKKTKKSKVDKRNTTFEGLPIVDATKDVALVINKRDVTMSNKKDPYSCAAALAGRREFHTDVRVYLTRTYVKDQKKQRWIRFVTPVRITKEIIAFDRGAAFEPGEYELKAPTLTQALGWTREKPTGPKNNKGQKIRKYHATANVRMTANDKVEAKVKER